jgi:hypothetical protein
VAKPAIERTDANESQTHQDESQRSGSRVRGGRCSIRDVPLKRPQLPACAADHARVRRASSAIKEFPILGHVGAATE